MIETTKGMKLLRPATCIFFAFVLVLLHIEINNFKTITADAAGRDTVPLGNEEELGDWLHYNGLIFGDVKAYQADAEGAVAAGGNFSVVNSGYDVGASYGYQPTVQIGQYLNPKHYPTLMIAGTELSFGSSVSHLNVTGGPIVMTAAMHQKNDTLNGFVYNGGNTKKYVAASQEALDNWFNNAYQTASAASRACLAATVKTISLEEFTGNGATVYSSAYSPQEFINTTLTYNGEIDNKTLIITVETGEDVEFIDLWGKTGPMKIPLAWVQEYEFIIYNFPNLENVYFNGGSQSIIGAPAGFNPNSPDNTPGVSAAVVQAKHDLSEKVLYNFPKVKNITAENLFFSGSVLAPNASFEANGGSLNGQLIADRYVTKGAHELHSLYMNNRGRELLDEPDEEGYGSVSLTKYSSYDGQETAMMIAGAEFILVKKEEDDASQETYYDGDGGFVSDAAEAKIYRPTSSEPVQIEDVPMGTYYIREINAPPGYILDEQDYQVFINKENTEENRLELSRYNEAVTTEVHFRKIEKGAETGLAGAKFTLYRLEDGNVVAGEQVIGTAVSRADGSFSFAGLPIGEKYMLVETKPPDGYDYVLENGIFYFKITADSRNPDRLLAVDIESGEPLSLTKENPGLIENQKGSPENRLIIYKYRNDGSGIGAGLGLGGAEFKLYERIEDAQGNVTGWLEVTESHAVLPIPVEIVSEQMTGLYTINGIRKGVYRLVETKAPPGYVLNNALTDADFSNVFPKGYAAEIEVKDEGQGGMYISRIPNNPGLTELVLKKSGEIAGKWAELANVSFRLQKYSDTLDRWQNVSAEVTDENGEICFENLEEGRFRISETDVPDGYQMLSPDTIYFDISFPDGAGTPAVNVVYDESTVDSNSSPVSLQEKNGVYEIEIQNKSIAKRTLRIEKIDSQIYQLGVDEADDKYFVVSYLEGAEFRLRRQDEGGDWQDYGGTFVSKVICEVDEEGNQVPKKDGYGNILTEAVYDGTLMTGNYQVVETKYPEGYLPGPGDVKVTLEDGTEGYVVHSFYVSESGAQGGESSYTITNQKDEPSGSLDVYKTDTDGEMLEGVPFKLWKVLEGAEKWDEKITLQEVMQEFGQLVFYKIVDSYNSSSWYTDENGKIQLKDITPGVYLLFEHSDGENKEFLEQFYYVLNHETTEASVLDTSFYLHLTTFKVAAVDEQDSSAGVYVEWVHREKIWSGEADLNDDGSISVINKRQEELRADVAFQKTDETGKPLKDAGFTLYQRKAGTTDSDQSSARVPEQEDFEELQSVTSDQNGIVSFTGLGGAWRTSYGEILPYRTAEEDAFWTEYMIKETAAPDGYGLSGEEIHFMMVANPLYKTMDFLLLDYSEEQNHQRKPGYIEPELIGGEGTDARDQKYPEEKYGTFIKVFTLNDFENHLLGMDFAFRKVDAKDNTTALEGAEFLLYECEHDETQDCDDMKAGVSVTSDENGLVSFAGLRKGQYRLVETKAPAGYELPAGQWRLNVDPENNKITITALGEEAPLAFKYTEESGIDYLLPNTAVYELPVMGGKSRTMLMTVGVLMIMMTLIVLYIANKKMESKKSRR